MTDSLKYEEIGSVSRADAERDLAGNDCERIARPLVALGLHDKDWKWAEEQCLRFLSHRSETVVSAAILSLGHTARTKRRLNTDIVVPALQALAADPRYAGKVQDTMDDIDVFLNRQGKSRKKDGANGNKKKRDARDTSRSQARKDKEIRKGRGTPSGTST